MSICLYKFLFVIQSHGPPFETTGVAWVALVMICIISNPKPQKALDEQVLLAEKTLAKTGKNDELKCESRELNSGSGVGNAR